MGGLYAKMDHRKLENALWPHEGWRLDSGLPS